MLYSDNWLLDVTEGILDHINNIADGLKPLPNICETDERAISKLIRGHKDLHYACVSNNYSSR